MTTRPYCHSQISTIRLGSSSRLPALSEAKVPRAKPRGASSPRRTSRAANRQPCRIEITLTLCTINGLDFSNRQNSSCYGALQSRRHARESVLPDSSFQPPASRTYPSTLSSRNRGNPRDFSGLNFSTRQNSYPIRTFGERSRTIRVPSEFAAANEPRDLSGVFVEGSPFAPLVVSGAEEQPCRIASYSIQRLQSLRWKRGALAPRKDRRGAPILCADALAACNRVRRQRSGLVRVGSEPRRSFSRHLPLATRHLLLPCDTLSASRRTLGSH
jgi:hypothetical protein